jgi:hypothetical protein
VGAVVIGVVDGCGRRGFVEELRPGALALAGAIFLAYGDRAVLPLTNFARRA